jgi:hypothetical protein
MFSLGHRPKNSNWRVTSAESAFQSGIGQNLSGLQPREQKRREDARTRRAGCAHSQSYREREEPFLNFAPKCFWSAMRPRIAFERLRLAWKKSAVLGTLMRESWPRAPPHYFTPNGIYIITAATLHRRQLFDSKAKLNLFRDTTFELGETTSSFCRRGLSSPTTIISSSASKTARRRTGISYGTCTASSRYASTG